MFLVIVVLVSLVAAYKKDYSSHSLFYIDPTNVDSAMLQHLMDKFDVWRAVRGNPIEVFGQRDALKHYLDSQRLNFTVSPVDFQSLIVAERERITKWRSVRSKEQIRNEWHLEFHDFDETQGFFEDTCLDNEDNICHWIESLPPNYQNTWEGEKVVAVALASQGYNPNDGKPTVCVQFHQHAREWIAGAAATYIFEKFLLAWGDEEPGIVDLLNQSNIILLPTMNPDGHNTSWLVDRMWRKNMRINDGGSRGVDLNRNWNNLFGGPGSSPDPNSDLYHGPYAESEPETNIVAEFYRNIPNLVGILDIHSYGQLVLRPYSSTDANSPDEAFLASLGQEMAAAITEVNGVNYTNGKWFDLLYESTGVAQDYFYTNMGIPAYTIELRPQDEAGGGFIIDPSEIIPTGEELYQGILTFARALISNNKKVLIN